MKDSSIIFSVIINILAIVAIVAVYLASKRVALKFILTAAFLVGCLLGLYEAGRPWPDQVDVNEVGYALLGGFLMVGYIYLGWRVAGIVAKVINYIRSLWESQSF
jgi:disulfide bond formation protein DsbB